MRYETNVYPHNDLINLALYNLENINEKVKKNQERGLALDCLNCIISLAFSVEAIINFVGYSKVIEWKERDNYLNKMKKVCTLGDHVFDEKVEPYQTFKTLKSLRDNIAHVKPKESEIELTNGGTSQEAFGVLAPIWNEYSNPSFVNHACEMVKKFEVELFDAHGLDPSECRTYAISIQK